MLVLCLAAKRTANRWEAQPLWMNCSQVKSLAYTFSGVLYSTEEEYLGITELFLFTMLSPYFLLSNGAHIGHIISPFHHLLFSPRSWAAHAGGRLNAGQLLYTKRDRKQSPKGGRQKLRNKNSNAGIPTGSLHQQSCPRGPFLSSPAVCSPRLRKTGFENLPR